VANAAQAETIAAISARARCINSACAAMLASTRSGQPARQNRISHGAMRGK